ncbi:gustatory receptor for bitter taste 93a [Anastrepha obliqua]|uniref:gustatory receptor for bitter taste 93a n=1 Tax=Anastrepha obliqua TaxID=95512 RepID=UPI00240A3CA0|nr:gustatory receptor for bitter taste 93a [Anastrepha obliqua]
MVFMTVMPTMLEPFITLSANTFISIFAHLQVISVSVFSVVSFVIQGRSEKKIFDIINGFIKLYKRISSQTGAKQILGRAFTLFIVLKLLLSFLGLIYEIALLLEGGMGVDFMLGVYLWLALIYVLDCCFVGFLVIKQMYIELAAHLMRMLDTMSVIESEQPPKPLSKHQAMKLLCVHAESIDESNAIYKKLYEVTKEFLHIFRWQIFYYIYYNFVITLMLMLRFIWRYLDTGYFDLLSFFASIFKFCNLTLLILCAHGVVEKSQLPEIIDLDLVCSDIDARWDVSVETFICQRKVENLEISVLGLFHLNNGFILVIISAIMAYLFILIQFGLTKNS